MPSDSEKIHDAWKVKMPRRADVLGKYAAKDAELTIRLWREFARIDEEARIERHWCVFTYVCFGLLAIAAAWRIWGIS